MKFMEREKGEKNAAGRKERGEEKNLHAREKRGKRGGEGEETTETKFPSREATERERVSLFSFF